MFIFFPLQKNAEVHLTTTTYKFALCEEHSTLQILTNLILIFKNLVTCFIGSDMSHNILKMTKL